MYRQGAVGALLDIYETAIADLKKVISDIPADDLARIVDPNTGDSNCRSIQTILTHVVHAGFGYATSIRKLSNPEVERPAKKRRPAIAEYLQDLDKMFVFTTEVLKDTSDAELEEFDDSKKMLTGWGQRYDIEQLFEHAIVHILRHRRQIEKIQQQVLILPVDSAGL